MSNPPLTPAERAAVRRADHRVDGIDGLRAIAALGVFFFHLAAMPLVAPDAVSATWRAVWRHGHLGVPLFFVISGLCIGRTWLRSTAPDTFMLRRLRRIFPAYWGSLALTVALAFAVHVFAGTNDVASIPTTPGTVLATLSLTTAPVTSVPALSGVYWSLSFELAFYLVMAALLFVAPTWRPGALVATHALLCCLACWPISSSVRGAFFVELWPLFGTGSALALWSQHRRPAFAMLGASLVATTAALFQDRLIAYWLVTWLGTALCAATLSGRISFWPVPLLAVGRMSYSLYLFHVPLGGYFYLKVLSQWVSTYPSEILWQLLVVAATSVAVWPFYRFLEVPFHRARPDAPKFAV